MFTSHTLKYLLGPLKCDWIEVITDGLRLSPTSSGPGNWLCLLPLQGGAGL